MSLSFETKTGLERTKTFHAALQTHTGGHGARKRLLATSHFHNGVSALKLSCEETWLTLWCTHGGWICLWGPSNRSWWMHWASLPSCSALILLLTLSSGTHTRPVTSPGHPSPMAAAQKPQRFSIALNKSSERSKYPGVQNASQFKILFKANHLMGFCQQRTEITCLWLLFGLCPTPLAWKRKTKGKLSSWILCFEIWSSSFNLILHLTVKEWAKHWQDPSRSPATPASPESRWTSWPRITGAEAEMSRRKKPVPCYQPCREAASPAHTGRENGKHLLLWASLSYSMGDPGLSLRVNWAR